MRIATVLAPLALWGCIYLQYEAEPDDIVAFAHAKQKEGAVQNLLWYQGRDRNVDHFKYVYGMFAERRFKVRAGAIDVPKELALTDDSTRWIAVPSIGNKWIFNTP